MALRLKQKTLITSKLLLRGLSTTRNDLQSKTEHHRFAVVGGGAGGLSVASYLARKFPNQVAVIEPSDVQ